VTPNLDMTGRPAFTPADYLALCDAAPHTPREELQGQLIALTRLRTADLLAFPQRVGFARKFRSGTTAIAALVARVLDRHDTAERVRHCLPFPGPPSDPAA
jgi:hypothetical protein